MPPLPSFPSLPGLRRRSVLAAGAGALCLPASAANPDTAGVVLRVGTYKGNWRALFAAARQPAPPYTVDWRELNNGTLHVEAIQADALDIGFGSEIPAVFAARQQAALRIVAVVREDLNNLVTVARGPVALQRIADLKGRRVAYARGTIAHYFLSRQLSAAGLSLADIQSAHLAPADALQAFARGDVDAWSIWGYNGQLARLQFGGRVLQTADGHASGNFPVFANPRALDAPRRAAAIGDFLLRLRSAYLWANGHFIDFARAQSAETRVAVGDLVELWLRRSTDYAVLPASPQAAAAHQQVADVLLRDGVLDAPTRVAPLWDARYAALMARSA